jgi:hypothetical protein
MIAEKNEECILSTIHCKHCFRFLDNVGHPEALTEQVY